jgi:hypothetical protein
MKNENMYLYKSVSVECSFEDDKSVMYALKKNKNKYYVSNQKNLAFKIF